MDWQRILDPLRLWYGRAAQFYLFQSLLLYIVGCVAAGHPLGPAKYASFIYHLFLIK